LNIEQGTRLRQGYGVAKRKIIDRKQNVYISNRNTMIDESKIVAQMKDLGKDVPKKWPSEAEIGSFLRDLSEYDDQHSQGTWLGTGMAAGFMSASNEQGEPLDRDGLEKLHTKISNYLTATDLESRHGSVLDSIGLSLESPNTKGDIDENETYVVGDMKINLADRTRYLAFLKSIGVENVSEEVIRIVNMVAGKLSRQVQEWYDLKSPDDNLLELFSGMRNIISEYERIGIGENVKDMKEYLHYSKEGCLREYILARKHTLFDPIGSGFNLSRYQIDSTPEGYLEYWQKNFFDVMDAIKKNENAGGLYNDLLRYAKDSITFAESDPTLEQYEANAESSYDIRGLRTSIAEVKQRVESLTEM
jgi:hypothetical protein